MACTAGFGREAGGLENAAPAREAQRVHIRINI
jgi:hypothetical protein